MGYVRIADNSVDWIDDPASWAEYYRFFIQANIIITPEGPAAAAGGETFEQFLYRTRREAA